MIRCVALCLVLAGVHPALAQTAPSEVPDKTVVAPPLGWQPWERAPSQDVESRVRYYTTGDTTFLELDLGPEAPREALQARYLADPPRAYFDVDFGGDEAPPATALLTSEITGIRFGLHRTSQGRVLRCVIDLRHDGVRIVKLEPVDGKLVLELAGR